MSDDVLDTLIEFLLAIIPVALVFIDIEDKFWRGVSIGFIIAFYPSVFIIKYLKKKDSKKKMPM